MLFFDVETNGLLEESEDWKTGEPIPEATMIHCINIYDGETHQHERYDQANLPVAIGVKRLLEADSLCGHNIIGYDVPVIKKLFPGAKFNMPLIDTYVLAKLCFPLIIHSDFKRVQQKTLPGELLGKHKLEAWGYRLGVLKGTFAKETDWKYWTPAMSDYCEQDVVVTIRLYDAIMKQKPVKGAVDLELAVDTHICKQERVGVGFNEKKANKLLQELIVERGDWLDEIHKSFHPFYKQDAGKVFIPKRDNKSLGYVKGAACSKIKLVDFNPTSAQHVYVWLRKRYGWEPTEFTKKSKIPEQFRYLFADYYKQLGQSTWLEPKISDLVLEELRTKYKEAKPIGKVMTLSKRIAALSDGNMAWLKHVKNGVIKGACNPLGTRTRRATHFAPNLAQVPAVYSEYGKECRDLFHPVTPGWVQVGADASSIEASVLAHYTYPFDGGTFAKLILSGKLHDDNAVILGLSRDDAKTFFYAFIYGAGNKKLGNIAKRDAKYGKMLRERLLERQTGLGLLVKALKRALKERGCLLALDKQRLPSISDHSALNTLCQCAGSLVVKRAMVIYHKNAEHIKEFYNQMLWVHDEFQCECHPDYADELGQIMVDSFKEAGEYYNIKIPLTGEFKVGKTWKETH